jgi:hypothetical protein
VEEQKKPSTAQEYPFLRPPVVGNVEGCAPLGSIAERHGARRHIANRIIQCAKSGARTLEALSEAGRIAATEIRPKRVRQSTRQKETALAGGDQVAA